MSKILILRTWATIQIVANFFVLFFSLYYFESYALFAVLFVTGTFIVTNTHLLIKSIKSRIFSYYPALMENNIKELSVIVGFLIYSGIRSFIFIKALLAIQYIVTHNIQDVSAAIANNIITILIYGCLTITIFIYEISKYYDNIRSYDMNDHVLYHIEKYKLDANKTYFYAKQNSITGFVVGNYKIDLYQGLKVGEHNYKLSLLLDYLNIAGIGFHELDDGHIKNIEMYGISD